MDQSQRFLVISALLTSMGGVTSAAPAQERLFRWDGEKSYDAFGLRVAGAGDFTQDGCADLLIGAPFHSLPDPPGRVYLYSGRTGFLLQVLDGKQGNDSFGVSVSSATDLNQDGVEEILIGSSCATSSTGSDGGILELYDGKSLSVLRMWGSEGQLDRFGSKAHAVGDVDGDGISEFLCAAPYYIEYAPFFQVGRVYLYSGLNGGLLQMFTGQKECDFLGKEVSAAGDLDGDLVPDLAVYAESSRDQSRGKLYVYSGRTRTLLYAHEGTTAGMQLGTAVAASSDLDGDASPDLLAGAIGALNGRGAVFVYSGPGGVLTHELYGENEGDAFGNSLAVLGDMNHDQSPEFAVGAYGTNRQGPLKEPTGSVYLYSGRSFRLLYRFDGENLNDSFGSSLAAAGDVDADGIPDLIVGAPWGVLGDGTYPGRAHVFAGNDLFLQIEPTIAGPGHSVSIAVRGGSLSSTLLIALVELNGTPLFVPVFLGALDRHGEWSASATVPSGLGDLTVGFQAFAFSPLVRPDHPRLADSSQAIVELTAQ